MANEDYNAELYFKMQDSMDRYTDWLKNQPSDEILNHTYEYTIKQDILMAFEEMDLSDAQAKALLNTKDPLEEVFKHFEKQETEYMQTLRDCITERGDELAAQLAEKVVPEMEYRLGLYNQVNTIYPDSMDESKVFGIAIQAYRDGEPYSTLTTNLYSRMGEFCEMIGIKNAAYVDLNNNPWATQLLESGVAKDTGFTKQSGFCEYPLWQFNEDWLKSLKPIVEDRTYDDYEAKYNAAMGIGAEEEISDTPDRISVIYIEPGKEPVIKEIDSGLESFQHEVGGDIEATYPFDDPVALLCNEEGKLTGLTLNRALCDGDGEIYDIIAGSFLIVGCGDEDFTTVPAELTDKYIEMFKQPETFMRYNGEILAIKDNEKDKIPVYLGSGADARMSGELDAYRLSFKTNMECKKSIEQAISDGYHDNTMKDVLVEPIIEKYGLQRVKTVLAITCIEKDWDARISRTNKEWAKTVPVPKGEDGMGGNNNAYLVCEKPHIGLVNIFIDKVRAFEEKQQERKPSVLGKLDEAKNKILPPVPKNNHKKEKSL